MDQYLVERDEHGEDWIEIPYRGRALLSNNMYNRGTAFTHHERDVFELSGLLPTAFSTIADQVRRAYGHLQNKTDPLEQFIGLAALERRNTLLFYKVLLDHFEELMPIVYTPTVGRACQEFSHTFRQGRGLWITPDDRGRIGEILGHAPWSDVRLIVVTDGERILGLGDQGAGGMWIPVGKISLYVAGAGFHPTRCLPVSLDVGTDNPELLGDDFYMGWRHRRVRGDEYDDLVEEFVAAVRERFPCAVLQWEDFKKGNAIRLLDRFRSEVPSFNDDIEGTAAVAVAGVIASTRATGVPLKEQRIVLLGAGAAGVGIARLLRAAFESEGLSRAEVQAAMALLDSGGLLVEGRSITDDHKLDFVWPRQLATAKGLSGDGPFDLTTTVAALEPTVLIGTSGSPGLFDERTIRTMAAAVDRPVIFPFSNPTSKSEATPAELLEWTDGRALVATGSPFDPVRLGDRVVHTGQGNNVYVFPGVGLGVAVSEARQVTQEMFWAAATTLADMVSDEDLAMGRLYPPLSRLRTISLEIATAVGKVAMEQGLAEPTDDESLRRRIADFMWEPGYPRIKIPG